MVGYLIFINYQLKKILIENFTETKYFQDGQIKSNPAECAHMDTLDSLVDPDFIFMI